MRASARAEVFKVIAPTIPAIISTLSTALRLRHTKEETREV